MALSFLLVTVLSSCGVELYDGLDEKEANEIMGKLLLSDIPVSKQIEKGKTASISVDEKDFGRAVELLKHFGLPRKKYETMGQIFSSEALVSSPLQEWARFNFALTQELSRTIESIPGVVSASVHIANPRKETPFDKPPLPKAAVLILIDQDAITADLIPQIKQLVSHSVENVEYNRVSVVISPVDPIGEASVKTVGIAGVVLRENTLSNAVLLFASGIMCSTVVAVAGTASFLRRRNSKNNTLSGLT